MRRILTLFSVSFAIGVLSPLCLQASTDVTLLMVPREEVPVRLGMDVGNRFPTLLLSYRMLPGGAVSLNGWNGVEWIKISPEAFAAGTFAPTSPAAALIVEKPGMPVPESLIPDAQWCAATYKISTAQTRPLLHLLGRHYDFKFRDWTWFSEAYELPLDSINPDGLNVSWYHRRLGENLRRKPLPDSDLQYLSVVYITPPVVEEEALAESEKALAESEKALAESEEGSTDGPEPESLSAPAVETVADNPLTNAAPRAVVFDAAGSAASADEADAEAADDDQSEE